MKVLKVSTLLLADDEYEFVAALHGAKCKFTDLSGKEPDTAYISPLLYARAKDYVNRRLEPTGVLSPRATIRLFGIELVEAVELDGAEFDIELVDFKTDLDDLNYE